jgi:hypothetical protein
MTLTILSPASLELTTESALIMQLLTLCELVALGHLHFLQLLSFSAPLHLHYVCNYGHQNFLLITDGGDWQHWETQQSYWDKPCDLAVRTTHNFLLHCLHSISVTAFHEHFLLFSFTFYPTGWTQKLIMYERHQSILIKHVYERLALSAFHSSTQQMQWLLFPETVLAPSQWLPHTSSSLPSTQPMIGTIRLHIRAWPSQG